MNNRQFALKHNVSNKKITSISKELETTRMIKRIDLDIEIAKTKETHVLQLDWFLKGGLFFVSIKKSFEHNFFNENLHSICFIKNVVN